MGKKTPSAPAAPDPVATANAQGAANRDTAIAQQQLNMVGQNTPWGSLSYNQSGTSAEGNPMYTATTTLSPAQQQTLNLETEVQQRMLGTGNQLLTNAWESATKPLNLNGLPAMPDIPKADESARTAALARILARANPELDRQRDTIENRLATQGINVGSQAYGSGVDEFNRSRNDFNLGADIQAGDEMSRLFGLQLAGYDRGVGARQQGISERVLPRNQTINELAALTGGGQVQMPQWAQTPQTGIAPTDVIGANQLSYGAQQNAYNQQMGQRNANMTGLYGLGAAGLTTASLVML